MEADAETAADLPRIISVDDHVVEPAHVWTNHLPERWRERGPRVARRRGRLPEREGPVRTASSVVALVEEEGAPWVDSWIYEDLDVPFLIFGQTAAGAGRDPGDLRRPVTYDDIRPGCYEQSARLEDMDTNHTEASLCFPTFPRFCGQTFLERKDKELALACVRAYNDWMIDEWCAGEGYGRLIPLTLVPLWDPELAAAEVRRCAEKGSHAIAFSENPALLGLPSVHGAHWDPLFAACEETDTVISMHIGSSSQLPTTGPDAPYPVVQCLVYEGSVHAVVDWLCSGVLERFQTLRIALSEGQVGWMPFTLQRLDNGWKYAWEHHGVTDDVVKLLPRMPSTYVPGRIFGCIFDDLLGLELRDRVGMDQIMFETDYPHGDSTWPNSRKVAEELIAAAGLDEEETWKFLRGNAIACYRLDRLGLTR